jgi:hypothetical protein
MSNYIDLPSVGDGHWRGPVALTSDLPLDGNQIGDVRLAEDTNTIYVWNGSSWIAVATPGAAIAIDGLIGDVSASGPGVVSATVNSVGGKTAASIATSVNDTQAATSSNTPSTIVKRDGSGNFSAGTITASLNGNATNVTGVVAIANGGTSLSTTPTNGQLLIGNTAGNNYVLGNITSGSSNLTITNGSGSILLNQNMTRTTQSGTTYTVVAGDKGNLVDFTGSANTVFTLTAPGTLGNGFYCYLRNSGSAGITMQIVPASGNIDGLASFFTYPGDTRLVICDGSNFFTAILAGGYVEFATPGANTFRVPSNLKYVSMEMWGAGGGGGSGRAGAASSARGGGTGGGGGCYYTAFWRPSDLGTSITVTIGTGGTGGAAQAGTSTDGNNGNPGGNSTFGSLLTVYGGGAGAGGSSANRSGGAGGGILTAGGNGGSGSTSGGGPVGNANTIGNFGGGGTAAGGFGGQQSAWGGAGGAGSNPTSASAVGGSGAIKGGASGASGGNIPASNTAAAGAIGGSPNIDVLGGTSAGAAGTSGVDGTQGGDASATISALGVGLGAGSGGAGFDNTGGGTASNGGRGGNAGIASGGGGGGAALNGKSSGAGGNGGNGYCRIWYG